MKGMKWTLMIGLPFVLAGCYELEDGSIAMIFDGHHHESTGDSESGFVSEDTDMSYECGYDTLPDCSELEPESNTDSGASGVDWTACDMSDLDRFNQMKTGDTCDFNESCGGDFSAGMRHVQCINGVVSVSVSVEFNDDPPRSDALWTDCTSAMNGARADEHCNGHFTCSIPADNSCIEQWACNGEADWTQITHKMICNGSASYTVSDSEPVEDCTAAANARPLDACLGLFLCTDILTDGPYPIPPCSDSAGFCQDETTTDFADFAYCDGTALHFFSNFSLQ